MSGETPRIVADDHASIDGLLRRVLDLVAALRRTGVPASQSESIDAFRAIAHVDLLDRAQLREALAAVTVTSRPHRRVFDELFELYFPARPSVDPPVVARQDGSEADETGFVEELVDVLADGSDEDVVELARVAVATFGRTEGRDGSASYYRYRVDRVVDTARLLADLLDRAQDDQDDQLTPIEERLLLDAFEERIRTFRDEVATDIRRRSAEDRGRDQVADRTTRPPVDEIDLFQLTAAERAELQASVRPLARKLAARVSVERRRARDGRLDVRRTVRRSLSTGGVPFETVVQARRRTKPELFVVCDVSASVASFARFTLLLVHALQEQFSRVRSFAFIDTLDEVTRLFEGTDPDEAMRRMMTESELVAGDGHSDYGRSLARFHHDHAASLTPRSTVIVLGDARNNHRQANAWVLEDLRRRAGHLYWLNPEPMRFWDTGDSIAASYARHVDEMVEVRTLRQLARFVERIA